MHGLEYGNGPIGLVLHIAGVMVIVPFEDCCNNFYHKPNSGPECVQWTFGRFHMAIDWEQGHFIFLRRSI